MAADGARDIDLLAERPESVLPHARPAKRTGQRAGDQVVTLTCFRFTGVEGLRQIGTMASVLVELPRTPGIGFARMMGTGSGFGFNPWPNFGVWALIASWPDLGTARTATTDAPIWRRRLARAEESCTLFLRPLSATGRWGGMAPFEPAPGAAAESTGLPLAVLTRATIRLRHAARFWARVPAINTQIADEPGMLFRLGMGEVPLLHQVTFSVWQDPAAMRAFAYRGEGHARAVAMVRAGDWFSEELYARFAVLETTGTWHGHPPLRA